MTPAFIVNTLSRCALVAWAGTVSVLALIDVEHMVLPTPVLRCGGAITVAMAIAAAAISGEWTATLQAVGAVVVAAAFYGSLSFLRPSGLGFGDVRMACLVAFGDGLCSFGVALLALGLAPLATAAVSRWRGVRSMPLGAFLACAGVVGVVASGA